jgi:hypothetical protein
MTLPALDGAVLVRRLAQIAQLRETYVPKTGQTGQTDHAIENAWEFGAHPGQKLTSAHQKLTNGTAQRPSLGAQHVGSPIDSAHGAPQP